MDTQQSNTLSICLDTFGLYQDGDRYSLCPIGEHAWMTELHRAVQQGAKDKIVLLLKQAESLHK